MKRKHSGIAARKFTGMKKSAIIKQVSRKLQKNPAFASTNKSQINQILQATAKCYANIATDRPKYISQFFAGWQAMEACVRAATEQMLAERIFVSLDLGEDFIPYGTFSLSYFAQLMDNLTYEEEDRLRDALIRMDGAWGMYFSVIKIRWPKLNLLIDRAAEIRELLQLEVQRLFFGEIVPALTARWAVAFSGLIKALELIGKEASHDYT